MRTQDYQDSFKTPGLMIHQDSQRDQPFYAQAGPMEDGEPVSQSKQQLGKSLAAESFIEEMGINWKHLETTAFVMENISQANNTSIMKRHTERHVHPQRTTDNLPKAWKEFNTGRILYGSQFIKATQPAARKYLVKRSVEFFIVDRPEKLKKEEAIRE